MSASRISRALRNRIAFLARHRCGYCLTSADVAGPVLTMDHIIPRSKGGPTDESNLWLACRPCNESKHDRTHGRDPVSRRNVRLFNPREQVWADHFSWTEEGTRVLGLTPCGRATVEALNLNDPRMIVARARWVEAGWHPPGD